MSTFAQLGLLDNKQLFNLKLIEGSIRLIILCFDKCSCCVISLICDFSTDLCNLVYELFSKLFLCAEGILISMHFDLLLYIIVL